MIDPLDVDPDDFDDDLVGVAIDQAAARRRHRRDLRDQAGDDAGFGGVIRDLAENATPIEVATLIGRRHLGRIEAVGSDFMVLRRIDALEVVVMIDAIATLRVRRDQQVTGDRAVPLEIGLDEVLPSMARERESISVHGRSGECVVGILSMAGTDVIKIHELDGTVAYLPLSAIAEIELTG